jgi:hypothetical protein
VTYSLNAARFTILNTRNKEYQNISPYKTTAGQEFPLQSCKDLKKHRQRLEEITLKNIQN